MERIFSQRGRPIKMSIFNELIPETPRNNLSDPRKRTENIRDNHHLYILKCGKKISDEIIDETEKIIKLEKEKTKDQLKKKFKMDKENILQNYQIQYKREMEEMKVQMEKDFNIKLQTELSNIMDELLSENEKKLKVQKENLLLDFKQKLKENNDNLESKYEKNIKEIKFNEFDKYQNDLKTIREKYEKEILLLKKDLDETSIKLIELEKEMKIQMANSIESTKLILLNKHETEIKENDKKYEEIIENLTLDLNQTSNNLANTKEQLALSNKENSSIKNNLIKIQEQFESFLKMHFKLSHNQPIYLLPTPNLIFECLNNKKLENCKSIVQLVNRP